MTTLTSLQHINTLSITQLGLQVGQHGGSVNLVSLHPQGTHGVADCQAAANTTSLRNTYLTPCCTSAASCSRQRSSPCRCSSARPGAGDTLATTRLRAPAAQQQTTASSQGGQRMTVTLISVAVQHCQLIQKTSPIMTKWCNKR